MKFAFSKRFYSLVAGLAICSALIPSAASAGASTGTLTVQSAVVAKCTVTSATINFGNWDVITNGSSNLDQTQSITSKCTKGSSSVYITADAGSNGGLGGCSTTRAMSDGSSHYLCYELYTDNYTTVWNTTNSGGHTFAPSYSSSNTATSTVSGRIPSGQDAVVGTYTDSVTMTINY